MENRMNRTAKIACVVVLTCGTASVGLACDLPPLVAIPEKSKVGDKGPQIALEFQQYYEAMKAYSACIQADITAAGGDSAPAITKAVLVQRNNSAVAEVTEVVKVFNASVGGSGGPAVPGQPPPGKRNK